MAGARQHTISRAINPAVPPPLWHIITPPFTTRLTQGTLQNPRKTQPAAEVNDRQPSQLPGGTQPEPRSGRETPSRPTLDDQQKAFLAFLIEIEHPDLPVSEDYKRVGVSVRKGNEIRESLREQGFLLELELRSGRASAGRPMKCIMPSFQAFEQLGIAPPKGRGSAMHRQLQQMVAEGARAKGYTAKLEHELGNGGIVDVHLEKGQEKLAVEIAVISTPQREIAHISQCLQAGYATVYSLFADESLLRKTATLFGETCEDGERGRVRLLPVQRLSLL
jgi:hypothetical protein